MSAPQYLDSTTKPFVGSLKEGISVERTEEWRILENETHPLLAVVLLVFLVLRRPRAGGDNIAVGPEVLSVQLWLDLGQLRDSLHFYCHLVGEMRWAAVRDYDDIKSLGRSCLVLSGEKCAVWGPELDCSHGEVELSVARAGTAGLVTTGTALITPSSVSPTPRATTSTNNNTPMAPHYTMGESNIKKTRGLDRNISLMLARL